jgi:hypothetical protein
MVFLNFVFLKTVIQFEPGHFLFLFFYIFKLRPRGLQGYFYINTPYTPLTNKVVRLVCQSLEAQVVLRFNEGSVGLYDC